MKFQILYFIPIIIVVAILGGSWQQAVVYSEDHSVPNTSYVRASHWLSEHLDQGKVIVPNPYIFASLQPDIKDKIIDYQTLWEDKGISLRANTTNMEVNEVREYMKSLISNNNNNVKYVVIDWVYPYGTKLLSSRQCQGLGDTLTKATEFDFIQPYAKWSNGITICSVRHSS